VSEDIETLRKRILGSPLKNPSEGIDNFEKSEYRIRRGLLVPFDHVPEGFDYTGLVLENLYRKN
jgi:hypothetical protein